MASNDVNSLRRRAAEERLEKLLSDNRLEYKPANQTHGQDVARNAVQLGNIAALFEFLFAEIQTRKKGSARK